MAPASAPVCEEKAELLRVYSVATSDHSRAVELLHLRLGVLTRTEYERLREFAESTRHLAEQSRVDLEKHVAEHGC